VKDRRLMEREERDAGRRNLWGKSVLKDEENKKREP